MDVMVYCCASLGILMMGIPGAKRQFLSPPVSVYCQYLPGPHHTRYPGYRRTPGILGITSISVKLPTCQVSPVSPIIPYTSISSESLAIPGRASIFASSVFKVLRITMNCESKSNGLIHQQ